MGTFLTNTQLICQTKPYTLDHDMDMFINSSNFNFAPYHLQKRAEQITENFHNPTQHQPNNNLT